MLPFVLVAAAQVPQVISYEPVAATPWTQSFKASCYGDTLEIVQPARPIGAPVTIRFNGRKVGGDTRGLQQELGKLGAAYRFAFTCAHPKMGSRGISLRWVRGFIDGRGRVNYRAGTAQFHNGRLVAQTSEDANAETFWYR